MSIAVLTQVYDEARRLAVAGSVVARGDFRLKKLLPPLAQAAPKAPVFAEVADYLADEVLPLYGGAILSELRAKYDPKGTKGHPRRLKLMHALDPAGARELVTQALEVGSKDVKVAAIECLGAAGEDLSYL